MANFEHATNLQPWLLSDSYQHIGASPYKFGIDSSKIKENVEFCTQEIRFARVNASWVLYLRCESLDMYEFSASLMLNCDLFQNRSLIYTFNVNLSADEQPVIQTPDYCVVSTPVKFNISKRFDLHHSTTSMTAIVTMHCSSHIFKNLINFHQKLARNNLKMLSDTSYSDITFMVEGMEFKLHKNILSASSPGFSSLFKDGTSRNTICLIEDISAHTFGQMISFIYGGVFSNEIEKTAAMKLYEAAYTFKIIDLMEICEEVISSKLTNDNALALYAWSELYEARELKDDAKRWLQIAMPNEISPEKITSMVKRKEHELFLLKRLKTARNSK